ncbi:MAG: helix-turn-helix domain-containing protein [Lachnospiraceae bacterium]|nr:helix-turn-helix domain-containing protein [Lachnospiraceae bacterium]
MINGLPQKLKTLRNQYGYSQKQVAAKLGVSPSIVSGYETGERTPSTEILLALSYLYQCSTDYLLGRQVSTPSIVLNTTDLTERQIQAIHTLIESIQDK